MHDINRLHCYVFNRPAGALHVSEELTRGTPVTAFLFPLSLGGEVN